MQGARLEGIVPIMVTPFDAAGRIDEDSLESLVRFNVAAGVHGVGVALGSEIFKLCEAERTQVIGCVVRAAAGRVPVVVNTGAAGTDLALHYARGATDLGATALMIYPPSFMPVSAAEIIEHFGRIADAVALPIILQDIPQAPIPPGLALRIAERSRSVTHVKVETLPVTTKVAEMVAGAGHRLTVLGGAGGSYFIEELRRGARGTMPFCSQPAAFMAVWERFESGDLAGARAIFDATIMAVNRLAAQGGDLFYHVHKQLLVRLGVIRCAHVRGPTVPPDSLTQREIDEVVETVLLAMRSMHAGRRLAQPAQQHQPAPPPADGRSAAAEGHEP